jgi:hypothetical protein
MRFFYPGPVRFVLRLSKAEQLGLFGRRATSGTLATNGDALPEPKRPAGAGQQAPLFGGHVEIRPVKAHTRQTEHGAVAVAPHLRAVHVAPHAPPHAEHPPAQHASTDPQNPSADWQDPDTYHNWQAEGRPMPAAPEVPTPTPAEPPSPSARPEESAAPSPVPALAPVPVSVSPEQPARLAEYVYRHLGALVWAPEGSVDLGGGAFVSPSPIHYYDLALLGIEPVQRTETGFAPRRIDPYERGVFTVPWTDSRGNTWDDEHPTSGAAPREIFAPLVHRFDSFVEQFHKMVKRAKKIDLEPPAMEKLAIVKRKIAVGLIGSGSDARVIEELMPAQLVRITNPTFHVKGWTLQAVIKPLEGTTRTLISRIGDAADMPDRMRNTGMHCDHCGQSRDRNFVVAMRNNESGNWKQVGGSCLADFTGRSASNLAASTEYIANWWKSADLDSLEEEEPTERGTYYHEPDDVLLAALHVIGQDGAYISKAKEEESGGMLRSTARSVRELLERPLEKEVKGSEANRAKAAEVKAWAAALPEANGRQYLDNLAAIGQATGIHPKHVGLLASAIPMYERAQEERVAAERAKLPAASDPGHFGQPGDRIGRPATKAERAAGVTEHPPQRVKVLSVRHYSGRDHRGDEQLKAIVTAQNADGHRFQWFTGAAPTHKNLANNVPNELQQIAPGETFDMIGTIDKEKGHDTYKGIKSTKVTRAEFRRVFTPDEEAAKNAAEHERRATQDAEVSALREVRAKYSEVEDKYRSEADPARPYDWGAASKAWDRFKGENPDLVTKARLVGHYRSAAAPHAEYIEKRAQELSPEARASGLERYDHPENEVKEAGLRAARRISDARAHLPVERAEPPAVAPPPAKKARAPRKLKGEPMAKGQFLGDAPVAPKPKGKPAPGGPPPAAAPPTVGAVPPTPGRKVAFRHPDTGEETEGHVHATGAAGATIVDGHGTTHRVAHGAYMHADADAGADAEQKPRAALVRQAAHKHLELGPDKPLGVHAAAALLVCGGVSTPPVHTLTAKDVAFNGDYAMFAGDKLRTNEPDLVKALQQLAQKNAKGPLFGPDLTEQSLTTYVRRFGIGPMGGKPAPLEKASQSAFDLPTAQGRELSRWDLGHGYSCRYWEARNGVCIATVTGPDMPLPLHDACSSANAARMFATQAVTELRKGSAPRRGVYKATREPK